MRWKSALACCLVAVLLASPVFARQAEQAEEPTESGVWNEVVRLYEAAKKQGEQVPKDVYTWARQDLAAHGTWEYRVAEVTASEAVTVEARLNELGTERWECIWIQPSGRQLRLILKRPVKSRLRDLPMSQLLKLLPGGGAGDSGS